MNARQTGIFGKKYLNILLPFIKISQKKYQE